MERITEEKALRLPGFLAVGIHVALIVFMQWMLMLGITSGGSAVTWSLFGLSLLVAVVMLSGYLTVQPNQSKALVFLGHYVGTVRDQGFWFALPFTVKRRVSLRVRNFNSERLKVNDSRGNPIELAAVVVWRVVDSARALFEVDDYEEFVEIQSETALRGLAAQYPYDHPEEDGPSLRGSRDVVAEALKTEVEERLHAAGVDVVETRLSHLAYAPEIAQAMLRRQQAEAIIAARTKIVEGAVGMVQMALHSLSTRNIVDLDEERKAAMVNNLLVVLTSETECQPVLNAGTIY